MEDASRLPKHTRALLDVASMEPVDVALEAGRVLQGPDFPPPGWLPADHRVVFRVPAAAVDLLDTREGRTGSQRIGLELWSGTLDPVRPDRVADRASCRPGEPAPCAGLGPGGGRMGARVAAGEHPLRLEVTNILSTEADRRRVLRGRVGMAPPQRGERAEPCDVREDPALGMLVARAPEGRERRTLGACRFGSSGATLRDGTFVAPRSFLKLGPEGEPRFSVRCRVYVTGEHVGESPSRCELQGHFGVWPLFLWVRSDRAPEWEATFEGVRDYLARHTVSRTDAPADAGSAP